MVHRPPGSRPVRQGYLGAVGILLLFPGARNLRRILRLLPQIPRLLEDVRPRPARRGAEEAVLQECAAHYSRYRSGRVPGVAAEGWRRRFACGVWAGESPAPPWRWV